MPDLGFASDRLRSFIERVERLEEEKRATASDIAEIYSEAKGTGFDPKIMRKIVARRRKDADALSEEDTLTDLYLKALGMLPLFEAAERVADVLVKEAPAETEAALASKPRAA